jgi:hypothetical protein
MKVSKILIFPFLFLLFSQCKKDKKEVVSANLLPDGKGTLYLETNSQSHSSERYYLKNNVLYTLRYNSSGNDTICFDREAGELFLNSEGTINISNLNFANSLSIDPCSFENDLYGGDTMICHFTKITEATSSLGKKYIKGDFYYNTPSHIPYRRREGIFTFGTN